MHRDSSPVEPQGRFEQLAHKGAVALTIGLGALAVREVWKHAGIGESVTNYAKSRAHKLTEHFRTDDGSFDFVELGNVTGKAFRKASAFVNRQILAYIDRGFEGYEPEATMTDSEDSGTAESEYLEEEVSAIVQTEIIEEVPINYVPPQASKTTPVLAPNTVSLDGETLEDEASIQAENEPEAQPEVVNLTEIFTNGEAFLKVYDNPELPMDVKDSLRQLVQAWRLIEAVPQAAMLWSRYVHPALQELKTTIGYPHETAQNLKNSANTLSRYMGAAVAHLREKGPESEQMARAIYETHVRGNRGQSNERAKFDTLAHDFSADVKKNDPEKAETIINIADHNVSAAVSQFLATTNPNLTQYEADQLTEKVKAEVGDELTFDKLTETAEKFKQQARLHESQQAAERRAILGNFLAGVWGRRGSNGHAQDGPGLRELNDIGGMLARLDDRVSYGHISNWEVEQDLSNTAVALARLPAKLDQDLLRVDEARSAVNQLLRLA